MIGDPGGLQLTMLIVMVLCEWFILVPSFAAGSLSGVHSGVVGASMVYLVDT